MQLVDIGEAQIEKGVERIRRSLDRLVGKGALTAELRDKSLASLSFSTSLESLAGADLLIEAIIENLEIKRDTWARLDRIWFANTKVDAAEIEFDDQFIYQEFAREPERRRIPMRQMLREEALAAFRDWQASATKIRY